MQTEIMTRREMEDAIIDDQSLYAAFDESRLLNDGYSDAEMRDVISQWIADSDECATMLAFPDSDEESLQRR